MRVRDGEEGERVEAKQGSVPDPDLVVTGDAETFLAVASGRLSPEEAVQSGALKVSRSVSSRSVEEKASRVVVIISGMCAGRGHSIGGEKILGVREGKTPIFIPAKLISYMAGIELRKEERRCRVRGWQPQEEVPQEYKLPKAEQDGDLYESSRKCSGRGRRSELRICVAL